MALTTTSPILLIITHLLLLLLFSLPAPCSSQKSSQRPAILVIMADDFGWSDVRFHNAEMHTPNLDRLAAEGVLVNYSYMESSCSPSRAAFLTGLYPFRLGMQHSVLFAGANESLPLDRRLFPQDLKLLNYSTHYVGKWHLGFCRPEMTPTYRGFDTFYGMYLGKGSYFTHRRSKGYDLQDNVGHGPGEIFKPDIGGNGTYSTYLFTNRTIQIINNHDRSKPLFIFLSYQAVHGPLEVPERHVTEDCANLTVGGESRKLQCGMGAAMDEGIGQIMAALEAKNLTDNLITLFLSDNGGTRDWSSNYPLRGAKIAAWEGGTRVITILHSKKHLHNAPYTWSGLMHAVDWYPTILGMAGVSKDTSAMDGLNNWDRIVHNRPSRRTEFVYTIDEVKNNSALRWMNYKLVSLESPQPNGWFNTPAGKEQITGSTSKYPIPKLFDLEADPSELTDLSADSKHQCILGHMRRKLESYAKHLVPTRPKQRIKAGRPENNGGFWITGWC